MIYSFKQKRDKSKNDLSLKVLKAGLETINF